jgi:DNA-nicking Smr family endonuclease
VVQDALDLHGATRDEARLLLADFLAESLRRGLRCVRVVHGKGLGSPGREPVLKGLVKNWLMQRAEVLAYCQARAAEGGAGALVLLLKSSRPQTR